MCGFPRHSPWSASPQSLLANFQWGGLHLLKNSGPLNFGATIIARDFFQYSIKMPTHFFLQLISVQTFCLQINLNPHKDYWPSNMWIVDNPFISETCISFKILHPYFFFFYILSYLGLSTFKVWPFSRVPDMRSSWLWMVYFDECIWSPCWLQWWLNHSAGSH